MRRQDPGRQLPGLLSVRAGRGLLRGHAADTNCDGAYGRVCSDSGTVCTPELHGPCWRNCANNNKGTRSFGP